ncbi:cell division protein FtsQ/DivIB [Kurthia massiliensis]|uniref:cell division protein FtsQ/DivIB n=1 Tax=Kurthia massiliensis TaxID=1033739 RepID=UPI000287E1F4|nr:FtsQ-type POTRA domain-containing protein [Kurthia massiliensis]
MEKIIEFSKLQEAAQEKKSPSKKPKKQKRPPKPMNKQTKKYMLIMGMLGICLLALLYLQLPISHIEKITVKGAALQPSTYYEQKSGLHVNESLWGYRNEEVITRLKQEKTVQSVTVSRKWPSDIHIRVKEYKPVAYVRNDTDRLEYVLENGAILPMNKEATEIDMPIMTSFKSAELREKTVVELAKLDEELLHSISEVTPNMSQDYTDGVRLYMTDGYIVQGDLKNLAEKLQYYPTMIEQLKKENKKKGALILEVGDFFKEYEKK